MQKYCQFSYPNQTKCLLVAMEEDLCGFHYLQKTLIDRKNTDEQHFTEAEEIDSDFYDDFDTLVSKYTLPENESQLLQQPRNINTSMRIIDLTHDSLDSEYEDESEEQEVNPVSNESNQESEEFEESQESGESECEKSESELNEEDDIIESEITESTNEDDETNDDEDFSLSDEVDSLESHSTRESHTIITANNTVTNSLAHQMHLLDSLDDDCDSMKPYTYVINYEDYDIPPEFRQNLATEEKWGIFKMRNNEVCPICFESRRVVLVMNCCGENHCVCPQCVSNIVIEKFENEGRFDPNIMRQHYDYVACEHFSCCFCRATTQINLHLANFCPDILLAFTASIRAKLRPSFARRWSFDS